MVSERHLRKHKITNIVDWPPQYQYRNLEKLCTEAKETKASVRVAGGGRKGGRKVEGKVTQKGK